MIRTDLSASQCLAVAAVIAAATTSCTHAGDPAEQPVPLRLSTEVDMSSVDESKYPVPREDLPAGEEPPNFDGPYADQLDSAYRTSGTSLQREVLEDGNVTELEYRRVMDDFDSCLTGFGFREFSYTLEGEFEQLPPEGMPTEDALAVHQACLKAKVGDVDALFTQMRSNPQNVETAELMSECYVRVGVVPPDYSAEDYVRDGMSGTMPFDDQDPKVRACDSDPQNAGK